MKRLGGIGLALTLGLALALPQLTEACGRHGTIAGAELQTWIESNWDGTDARSEMSAFGWQDRSGKDGTWQDNERWWNENGGWNTAATKAKSDAEGMTDASGRMWGNAVYQIDVTLPDGNLLVVKSDTRSWNSGVDGQSGGGRTREIWLRDKAKAEIEAWFLDFRPDSSQLDDYVG